MENTNDLCIMHDGILKKQQHPQKQDILTCLQA